VETFVMRVFVPADADGVPFCGVVERSGSGRSEPFQSAQDLIQIVLYELELGGAYGEGARSREEGSRRPDVEQPTYSRGEEG
jgi:hypothetical protein